MTDTFPPDFAPRMGYFCKYLSQMPDCHVTVVHYPAMDGTHSASFKHLVGFVDSEIEIEGRDGASALFSTEVKAMLRGRRPLMDFVLMVVSKILGRIFGATTNFKGRAIIRSLIENGKYDVVLASTGGGEIMVPRLAAYAGQKAGIPVLQDFRDLYEQYSHDGLKDLLFRLFCLPMRDSCVASAFCVTAVCDSEVEVLKRINGNAHLVMNGYDPDIFREVEPISDEFFNILYIGSTNTKTYPVSLFMKGVEEFLNSKACCRSRMRILFYSTASSFSFGVSPYIPDDLRDVVVNVPCVNQDELMKVFSTASVLLVFGHSSVGIPVGVSTKVFEYLAVNRPILEVNDGDDQECEEIIRTSGAGFVANSPREIEAFLQEKYSEWSTHGVVRGTTDMQYASRYSREKMAQLFLCLLKQAKA